MIKPKKLYIGDTIGIVSPSYNIKKGSCKEAIKFLKKLGFKIKLGKHIYSKYGFMAGTDEQRTEDINEMFKDKKVRAIFSTMGGSVCNRLLPLLDYKLIKKNPKVIMGLSDITVLINSIHKKTGLVTFHGQNVTSIKRKAQHRFLKEFNKEYMLKILTKTQPLGNLNLKYKVIKNGKAEGQLVGGNLEALGNLNGTPYMPDYKNKILFWEEIDEDASEISRILMNYKLCGIFDKINGMVIGKLYKCKGSDGLSVKRIIEETTKGYNFPIIYNVDFGHYCENITLPIGIKARIDTEKRTFEFLEPAVRK